MKKRTVACCFLAYVFLASMAPQTGCGDDPKKDSGHEETATKTDRLENLTAAVHGMEVKLWSREKIADRPLPQRRAAASARERAYSNADYLKDLDKCFEILERRRKALAAEEDVYKLRE